LGREELFRAGRRGFLRAMTWKNIQGADTTRGLRDLLTNETDLRRLKALGYKQAGVGQRVAGMVRRHCGQSWQPGQTGFIPGKPLPNGGSLALIYHSEDILIKDIPDE